MEKELIRNLLLGCNQAWETLVDGYGALVRSRVADVALALGRQDDWALIDDVTAEVFATLLARDAAVLRCFRGQSRLSTYLAVIATRIARRSIAKQVRQSHHQIELADGIDRSVDTVDPQATDPQSKLISREDRQSMLDLVDQLPAKQRMIVEAYYRDEWSYAEISERLDIPLGSIGNTLRRAEQRLRNWIDDETE